MALSSATLAASIRDMIVNQPQNIPEVASRWAQAYDRYAKGCATLPSGLTPLATQPAIIQGILSGLPSVPTVPLFASLLDSALVAYWMAIAFSPGTDGSLAPSPGLAVAVPGLLTPVLLALASPPSSSVDVSAQKVASAIHLWTVTNVKIAALSPLGVPVLNLPA